MDILLSFLSFPILGMESWAWGVFFCVILALIVFDLGVLNKTDKEIDFQSSVRLTLFYIACAIAFGVWVYLQFGSERAAPFFTAYLIEKSLSLDNVFVISIIFAYYKIPLKYQHRVLFWGIIGVIILRGIVISAGTVLITNFEWVLYLFALLLIYTGIQIFRSDDDDEMDVENSRITKVLTANFNITEAKAPYDLFFY